MVATLEIPQKPSLSEHKGGKWNSGTSGNPGGRPKGLMQYVRQQTNDGKELVDIALSIVRGDLTITDVFYGKDGDRREVERAPSHKDRLQALEWVADRGFGKAVETVQLQNPDGTAFRQTLVLALSQAISAGTVIMPPATAQPDTQKSLESNAATLAGHSGEVQYLNPEQQPIEVSDPTTNGVCQNAASHHNETQKCDTEK